MSGVSVFLTEFYPEIGWYLESDVVEVLAENLGVAPRDVLLKFHNEQTILAAKRIVQGRTTKRILLTEYGIH